MVQPSSPPANGFVASMRKVYNPVGFAKGYNFILFFIFGGALFGFALSRTIYWNPSNLCPRPRSQGASGAGPGECYWYENFPRYRVGIFLHLAGILPGALLAVFQFVPAIRHHVILYHRLAGYAIILLVCASNAGALMIADKAYGGGFEIQAFVGALVIFSTVGIFNAWWNIRQKQIEQHRAWMLRVWVYMSSIITERIIQVTSFSILSSLSARYYSAVPCAQIESMYLAQEPVMEKYAACVSADGSFNPDGVALVVAGIFADSGPENVAAAFHRVFGMSLWLALGIHIIGVELYLWLTPRETERLREVSYQKQLERGMKNPGSAGVVAERLGDAEPWVSKNERSMYLKEGSTPGMEVSSDLETRRPE